MESLILAASGYGLPGLMLLALAWFIYYMYTLHHKERKDWYDAQERQTDKVVARLERIIESIHLK